MRSRAHLFEVAAVVPGARTEKELRENALRPLAVRLGEARGQAKDHGWRGASESLQPQEKKTPCKFSFQTQVVAF